MYTKKEDKNLNISKIHHKRKYGNRVNMFGKVLNIMLAFFIIGSGMITVSGETFEGAIKESIQPQEDTYYQGDKAVYANKQLVLLDVTYDHNTISRAFSFFNLPSGMPSNLISPINYAQGTLYQRLQVLSKPSSKTVKYQICVFQDQIIPSKHACSNQGQLAFSGKGTYYASQKMSSLYQYGNLAWSRKLLTQMLVVKDMNGIPVDDRYGWKGKWSGSPNFNLYYPMKVHYTAIIVPPGGGAPIWPSGTGDSNSVTVTSPNGGENLISGTTKTIGWTKIGSPGSYVKIELLKAGTLNKVIASSTLNDGSHSWVVPSAIGNDYKIKVTSTSNSVYTDSSNDNFNIGAGSITVVSPNGGESLPRGTTKTISWTKTGSPGSYVKIELLKAGTLNKVIASSTLNDGSHSWVVPSAIGNDYKIKVTSTSNSVYKDISNNYFKIY